MKYFFSFMIILMIPVVSIAQSTIPSVYTNITYSEKQGYVFKWNEQLLPEIKSDRIHKLSGAMGNPVGTAEGFDFDFQSADINGTLYFGFIDFETSRYAQAVFFKRPVKIENGKAKINILQLAGKYDMIAWKETGKGRLGYRVELDNGIIYYDGVLAFEYHDKFKAVPAIVEGPILQMLTDSSVVIKFKTNLETTCKLFIDGQKKEALKATKEFEFSIEDLSSGNKYEYRIECGGFAYNYDLKTAPKNGSRSRFTFAYASDSRAGNGGGERHIWGTNGYIIKKSLALALQQKAVFMQFTGDLINGYSPSVDDMKLQYANFKKVISPFAPYMPFYVGIGNHEVVERRFPYAETGGIRVDRFPFKTESMEALFAMEFANHKNGPQSEDGMPYDPNPDKIDFPTYQENVYYYTYDNIAMIVLSSEYLYTPSLTAVPETSGGLHGYMMDGQLQWLEKTLEMFEEDENIDHVFVTQHTPAFPNGGHVDDAMWYSGDNSYRTIIAGKPLEKGIIEQRDIYLDLLVNKSSKVKAILTGDEHNYCKTRISEEMPRYPENWEFAKLKLNRSIYQINNGACGAPYYAQEVTPWTEHVSGFSTQNALVLLDVEGKNIEVRVLNPDTLEEIESYNLDPNKN
jgi:3',5'-cyclic AMP phosphodiesterase CpdA